MSSVIVSLSGGLDSTTLLSWFIWRKKKKRINSNIYVATIKYQSKHNQKEYEAAKKVIDFYSKDIKEVIEIDLSPVFEMFKSGLLKTSQNDIPEGEYNEVNIIQTSVPFRNGIIASVLCGIAESKDIDYVALGTHKGTNVTYPDCTSEFNKYMSEAMKFGTFKRVELLTPFESFTKADIVRLGHGIGTPYHLTWSCYKGLEKACGKCATCLDRLNAFKENNLVDPIQYFK